MKRRWKIFLVAAGSLVAVWAICFFGFREKEPSYNGRTLSEWLDCLTAQGKNDQAKAKEACNAIRAIGLDSLQYMKKRVRTAEMYRAMANRLVQHRWLGSIPRRCAIRATIYYGEQASRYQVVSTIIKTNKSLQMVYHASPIESTNATRKR